MTQDPTQGQQTANQLQQQRIQSKHQDSLQQSQQEVKEAIKALNILHTPSKKKCDNAFQATKVLMDAMKEVNAKVSESEKNILTGIQSAAADTALTIALETKRLDDPKLRRQSMLTLKALQKSLKTDDFGKKDDVEPPKPEAKPVAVVETPVEPQAPTATVEAPKATPIVESTPTVEAPKEKKPEAKPKPVEKKEDKAKGIVDSVVDTNGPLIKAIRDVLTGQLFPKKEKVDEAKPQKPEAKPVASTEAPQAAPSNEPTPTVATSSAIDVTGVEKELAKITEKMNETAASVKNTDSGVAELVALQKQGNNLNKEWREDEEKKAQESAASRSLTKGPTVVAPKPEDTNVDTGGFFSGIGSMIAGWLFGEAGLFKRIGDGIKKGAQVVWKVVDDGFTAAKTFLMKKGSEAVDAVVKPVASFVEDLGKLSPLAKLGRIGRLGGAIFEKALAPVFALYDFFDGFLHADAILGKTKEMTTMWDKVSAGLGSVVGGFAGIVDAITGFFGIETDIGGFLKTTIASFVSDLPKQIGTFVDTLFSPLNHLFTGLGSSIATVVKKMAIDALMAVIPGGAFLIPKLFPDAPADANSTTATKADAPVPVASVPAPTPMTVQQNPDVSNQAPDSSLGQVTKVVDAKKQQAAANNQTNSTSQSSVVNQNNINNSKTIVNQSSPIYTRPQDDSFRVAMGFRYG